jgi:hypothetical protein
MIAFVGLQQIFGFRCTVNICDCRDKEAYNLPVSWVHYLRGTLLCADLGGRAVQGVGLRPLG